MTAILQKMEFATAADAAELRELVNKAYRGETAIKGWTSESHLLDGSRIDEATLKEYIAERESVILKHTDSGQRIKGCVYLSGMDSGLYLGMLTVDPEAQNSGIGKYLLKQAETYAREMNKNMVQITVIDTRHELIAWYERHGYKKTGGYRPFPTDIKYGIPKHPLVLLVMEKPV